MPELSAADSFVLDVWADMSTRFGGGLEVVRMKAAGAGLDEAGALEVWERVCIVERAIQAYRRSLARG